MEIIVKKYMSLVFMLLTFAMLCMCAAFFIACGDEPTDETNDNVTFDTTKGELLELQEAYDAGYLDRDDLISAAYYYNEGKYNEEFMPEGYEPMPKEPETLDEATELAIRVAWLEINGYEVTEEYTQRAKIQVYCGMYNDCIIVKFEQGLYDAPDGFSSISMLPDYTTTVDGIFFGGNVGHFPVVWHITGDDSGSTEDGETTPTAEPQNCDIVLERGYNWDETYRSFISICDSYEEIVEEFALNGVSFASDAVRGYADTNASSKALIVCFYTLNGGFGDFKMKDIEVRDNTLSMLIYRPRSETATDIMCSYIHIAGVDKSFVENVTECEYVFI